MHIAGVYCVLLQRKRGNDWVFFSSYHGGVRQLADMNFFVLYIT